MKHFSINYKLPIPINNDALWQQFLLQARVSKHTRQPDDNALFRHVTAVGKSGEHCMIVTVHFARAEIPAEEEFIQSRNTTNLSLLGEMLVQLGATECTST